MENKMKIKFEGNEYSFESGVVAFDVAKELLPNNFREVYLVKVNEKILDLFSPIMSNSTIEFLGWDSEEGKKAYRHSSAHIMAQAVKRLYPDVKVAIGPAIQDGFYYDFDFKTPIKTDSLAEIETEMKKIIKERLPIVRKEINRDEAIKMFESQGEIYKTELISELPNDAVISIYTQGDFTDLCAGPHLPNTSYLKAYKLTSVTGAYWRGNEKNKMLTRIYGTSFDTKENLESYLEAQKEARARDHNKIGRELGFFMTDENIGQGLPLLMPKGAKLFQILSRFVEDEEAKRGYLLTKTPYMAKSNLYKISGHWDHYRDGMFVIPGKEENEVFALRPMTCPFQYIIYNNGLKSYKELPKRYAETSTLFRNESSGEMHGLIRVRQFTISEGHLICTPSQLEEEFKGCLDLARFMLKALGLDEDVSYRFSRWDPDNKEKYIDDPEKWEQAENTMKGILDKLELKYTIAKDEAAFYGPKLDIQIKNVFGKEDTMITIQVDMFLAENFDMSYVDENGNKERPYIIHRTSLGCYERTMALLIEKHNAALPVWMAPEQVRVLNLTERTEDEVIEVCRKLKEDGIRAEYDIASEKIGYKIRAAQLERVPYMIIIGDKEKESGLISVRSRREGELGNMTYNEFITKIKQEIKDFVIG
ncbi:MAG: threonine--tRNA ligase [Clostridiales bacterium]|jgi:threonyl-tRNA synthetase|nr:threonine--tRNA ligase [Clostridiales bacterium]